MPDPLLFHVVRQVEQEQPLVLALSSSQIILLAWMMLAFKRSSSYLKFKFAKLARRGLGFRV